jgi:hypothetical protein
MKKLMIAAALTAMIGSTQAATCVDSKCANGAGTAHKVAISLKTTAYKLSKQKDNCNSCNSTCVYWRDQATVKVNGLLWEQLPDCEDCYPFGNNSAFWTDEGALDVEFAIGVGLIGKDSNSKKIEAYGGLSGVEFGELAWAGFGSMAGSDKRDSKCATGSCVMYVKSITGGIAGQLLPEFLDWRDVSQKNAEKKSAVLNGCADLEYDGCCGDMQLANTAAYGTIKITYDKSTAKKVAADANGATDITKFYKLPTAAQRDYLDEDVTPGEVVIEE